jgi:hypothetical protein
LAAGIVDTVSSEPPKRRFLIFVLSLCLCWDAIRGAPVTTVDCMGPEVVDKFENLLILGNMFLNYILI